MEEEIRRFARLLGQLETLPTVTALREHGNALVDRVLAENEGRWESASERDLERVESIARAVCKRLLHGPTMRLREIDGPHGHASLQLARELFGLDSDPAPAERKVAERKVALDEGPAKAAAGGGRGRAGGHPEQCPLAPAPYPRSHLRSRWTASA